MFDQFFILSYTNCQPNASLFSYLNREISQDGGRCVGNVEIGTLS